MARIFVNIGKEDCLTVEWAVVLSLALFTVTTSADFEEKRTIYAVFLCAVDRSEVFGHHNLKLPKIDTKKRKQTRWIKLSVNLKGC